ncbi:MAG: RNA polymerase sigma factor [Bacteroidetes bacterium]|nr:RNA polymerase sigma factor [Bacteroidota bacterium]
MSEKEFLEQVNQNQGIIYKLVSLYAADAEEKKDLYQEILLQAWKSYSKFRNDAKFGTWLYRVSLNTILTQKRKEKFIDYKDSLEQFSDSLHNDPSQMQTANIQYAIRLLPETDRAIISMHLDGFENVEIASTIGISNNHVAVKLHRIKRQLSDILKQER